MSFHLLESCTFKLFVTINIIRLDADIHEKEVEEASNILYDTLIPLFAKKFVEKDTNFFQLIPELHRGGINIRHLGLIYDLIPDSKRTKSFRIVVEIIARTLRKMMEKEMRLVDKEDQLSFQQIIATFLNLTFGSDEKAEKFWQTNLKEQILSRFYSSKLEKQFQEGFQFREQSQFSLLLFQRIQQLATFTVNLEKSISLSKHGFQDVFFTTEDLGKILPRVKVASFQRKAVLNFMKL